jgi:hypothetical protein
LLDEAQLASARQVVTAATHRAARTTESDRRIPIRPKYHFAGDGPNPLAYGECLPDLKLRGGPPPSQRW